MNQHGIRSLLRHQPGLPFNQLRSAQRQVQRCASQRQIAGLSQAFTHSVVMDQTGKHGFGRWVVRDLPKLGQTGKHDDETAPLLRMQQRHNASRAVPLTILQGPTPQRHAGSILQQLQLPLPCLQTKAGSQQA